MLHCVRVGYRDRDKMLLGNRIWRAHCCDWRVAGRVHDVSRSRRPLDVRDAQHGARVLVMSIGVVVPASNRRRVDSLGWERGIHKIDDAIAPGVVLLLNNGWSGHSVVCLCDPALYSEKNPPFSGLMGISGCVAMR